MDRNICEYIPKPPICWWFISGIWKFFHWPLSRLSVCFLSSILLKCRREVDRRPVWYYQKFHMWISKRYENTHETHFIYQRYLFERENVLVGFVMLNGSSSEITEHHYLLLELKQWCNWLIPEEVHDSCSNAPFLDHPDLDTSKVYFGYVMYKCHSGWHFPDKTKVKAIYCPCDGDWNRELAPIQIGCLRMF